jgi:hypothetical protein
MSVDEDRPFEKLSDLLRFYNIQDLKTAEEQLPFVRSLVSLKTELEKSFYDPMTSGRAYAVEAAWGKGKTSFVMLLLLRLFVLREYI